MQLLSRNCPCCHRTIPLSERLVLLVREPLFCQYCAKSLQPHFGIMLFNVFWLSMSVSWAIKLYTTLDVISAMVIALLSASVLTPGLDLLFPLEEESVDDLE